MSFEISGLSFSYGDRAVLEGVDLSVADGELACVLGPNGVGKTTLFRCILGLERPRAGTILVNGRPLDQLSVAERAREMAFVPQSHAQVFDYEVLDVVLMSAASRLGPLRAPADSGPSSPSPAPPFAPCATQMRAGMHLAHTCPHL